MANPIFILDETEEGVVATHTARVELPVLAAHTIEENKKKFMNTIRPSLVGIGCMNLSNRGFEFDSSFISFKAKSRFVVFAEMMKRLSKDDPTGASRFPPITIFGHADPTGDPAYNKRLSGRRAKAVFGLLTRDVAMWESLFANPFGGDEWGKKSIQHMLQNVGGIPFYEGPIDGAVTPETKKATKEAIEAYQEARGLKVDGEAGEKTRKVLFAEYMDEICQFKDGTKFKLDPKEHFLARGKDKEHKADMQGCGEFNPVLLLSKDEEDRFKDKKLKPERDTAYERDRRALVFVFKHDTVIDPAKWPCPRVGEGEGGCKERFWSDHKDRLRRDPDQEPADANGVPTGDGRREFPKTGDTFACRWYHGFAQHSPCEAGKKLWVIRLKQDGPGQEQEPFARRAYVVHAGDADIRYAPQLRGFTTDQGQVVIPVMDEELKMSLKVDLFGLEKPPGGEDEKKDGGNGQDPGPDGKDKDPGEGFDVDRFEHEDKFVELTLDAGQLMPMVQAEFPAQQRLYNLGFGKGAPGTWTPELLERAVKGFQRSRGLEVTGQLDDSQDTRARLKKEHEGP
jgi:peptidoglycan hydrolase-like protein with peptidoglycan-binding domain